jgi:hypothetical protein
VGLYVEKARLWIPADASVRQTAGRLVFRGAKDNPAGNGKGDNRTGAWGALDREFSHDAGGTLAHALQTEMPRPATLHDFRIDAHAVIRDSEAKFLRIREFHSQLRGLRVDAGIADRLIPDAIHLVPDYGMHFLNLS